MQHGLTPEVVEKINTVFARFREVEEVVLYGSRAKGTFKPGSDIDFSLKGDIDFTTLLKITHSLDEADLPYRFDINIFSLLRDADLINHITRRGQSFYHR